MEENMVKILTKSEAFKTLKGWIKTDGADAQAYYLMTLREAMDVELSQDALIVVRCPDSPRQDG
jgi:hypothetical protein